MARSMTQLGTFDTLLELADGAAATTADEVGQVGAADKIVDLWQGASSGTSPSGAEFHGELQIDVSAMDVASTDEIYKIVLEGSSTSDFSSDIVPLAHLQVGNSGLADGGNTDADDAVGRYVVPFTNERNDTAYRYVRLYIDVTGTTPSITLTARMNKLRY